MDSINNVTKTARSTTEMAFGVDAKTINAVSEKFIAAINNWNNTATSFNNVSDGYSLAGILLEWRDQTIYDFMITDGFKEKLISYYCNISQKLLTAYNKYIYNANLAAQNTNWHFETISPTYTSDDITENIGTLITTYCKNEFEDGLSGVMDVNHVYKNYDIFSNEMHNSYEELSETLAEISSNTGLIGNFSEPIILLLDNIKSECLSGFSELDKLLRSLYSEIDEAFVRYSNSKESMDTNI